MSRSRQDTTAAQRASTLRVEGVSKIYQPFRPFGLRRASAQTMQALGDVSFSIEEGETVGLLGPNGAGKTTLLKIITTLIFPSAGRVSVCGTDVSTHPSQARRLTGLVSCDERSFYSRLSGWRNLSFFGALYGVSRQETHRRGTELLNTLGLLEAADRPYHGYSSGMKQKLAIVRGLLGNPRLVLYDEPTRSLDPVSTQGIRSWILERRQVAPWQTHLIATNQLAEAEQLCDRVLIVSRGRLIAQGSIAEIRARYRATEAEIHRITYRGEKLNGALRPGAIEGIVEARDEGANELGHVLGLRVTRGSTGLSRALAMILSSGGMIVQCEKDEISFDEIFCSLVVADASDAASAAKEKTNTVP